MPGVILYPASPLCPLLPLLFFGWVRACLWWGFPWDVSSLCGVCARVFFLAVGFARACSFLCPVAPFCLFVVCLVVSLSSALLVVSCSLFSASLGPSLRCLGFLGPLGNQVLTTPTRRNAT